MRGLILILLVLEVIDLQVDRMYTYSYYVLPWTMYNSLEVVLTQELLALFERWAISEYLNQENLRAVGRKFAALSVLRRHSGREGIYIYIGGQTFSPNSV